MQPKVLLDLLMKDAGLNPHSLAAKTNNATKQPQIYRFLHKDVKEPKRSTWEPVAKFFGIKVEAFFDPKEADVAWASYLERKAKSGNAVPPAYLNEEQEGIVWHTAGSGMTIPSSVFMAIEATKKMADPIDIGNVIIDLAKAVSGLDQITRAALPPLIELVLKNPASASDIAARVRLLAGSSSPASGDLLGGSDNQTPNQQGLVARK